MNGKNTDIEQLKTPFDRIKKYKTLSYYEFLFALFCERLQVESGLDFIILEVGLGGNLDSVNAFDAHLAAITSISRDHTSILGTKYRDILREKFGITRRKRPLVTAFEHSYLRGLCKALSKEKEVLHYDLFDHNILFKSDNFRMRNLLLASVLKEMILTGHFPEKKTALGIKRNLHPRKIQMPGRFQEMTLNGKCFIFVGTHNLDGFRKLCQYGMETYPHGAKEMDILMAFSKRPTEEVKNCLKLIDTGPRFYHQAYVTSFQHCRALPEKEVLDILKNFKVFEYIRTWKHFLESHDKSKTVLVLGSFYFISNILKNID